jgi:hypothetical protein
LVAATAAFGVQEAGQAMGRPGEACVEDANGLKERTIIMNGGDEAIFVSALEAKER